MRPYSLLLIVLIGFATVFLAGCTQSGSSSSSTSLSPQPTDAMPANIAVSVTVGEKDYLGNIPVTFNGGPGQGNVQSLRVTLTRVDGSTETESLGSNKGDTVSLSGTRGTGSNAGESDRVEVWVSMNNGQTYKIADTLRQYRSRSGSGE